MTREEKIAELINIRDNFNYTLAPREVFDDAIKALEQEPSGDAISRQAVKEWLWDNAIYGYDRFIDKIPPINPQEPKTGHWINDEDTIGCYYCSECGGYVASYDDAYCRYCGAKMIEQKESEDDI